MRPAIDQPANVVLEINAPFGSASWYARRVAPKSADSGKSDRHPGRDRPRPGPPLTCALRLPAQPHRQNPLEQVFVGEAGPLG